VGGYNILHFKQRFYTAFFLLDNQIVSFYYSKSALTYTLLTTPLTRLLDPWMDNATLKLIA